MPPRDIDLTKIKAFTFDVDGVFTDGGIFCDLEGELFRTFDAKDGFAVRMATMNGYPVGIITGGRSGSIRKRFLSCGVPEQDCRLGCRDKVADFLDFCACHALDPSEVLYVGDDVPDIPVFGVCGLGACPSDASEECRAAADLVSDFPGGRGCVRQIVSDVMKAAGRWNFDVSLYKKKF